MSDGLDAIIDRNNQDKGRALSVKQRAALLTVVSRLLEREINTIPIIKIRSIAAELAGEPEVAWPSDTTFRRIMKGEFPAYQGTLQR